MGKSNWRTFFAKDNMTTNDSIDLPSGFNECFYSFFTGNDWEFRHTHHSNLDYDLNDLTFLFKLFHPFFGKGFKTSNNCLFYILQSFFNSLSLRMTSRQRRTAYDISTFLSFLNDNFEFHGLKLRSKVDKGYLCWCSTNCYYHLEIFWKVTI